MSRTQVSVVIVNWNGAPLLATCLESLTRQTRAADEIVVVDNGSTDDSVHLVRTRFPSVSLVPLAVNEGFAGGANAGIRAATGEWVALINNDVVLDDDWLAKMLAAAESSQPAVGFITSRLLDADGSRIDAAGDFVDWAFTPHQRGHLDPAHDTRWARPAAVLTVCAAATFYRQSFFEDIGLFDERFFAYFEDADLCLRGAMRGWQGRYLPSAAARHATSSTSSRLPGFKRYQGTRNAWWLLYKNLPPRLAARVVPRFLITQLIWLWGAARERELGAALRGHADGLRGLRRFRSERRRIMDSATADLALLADFLAPPVAIGRARNRLRLGSRPMGSEP